MKQDTKYILDYLSLAYYIRKDSLHTINYLIVSNTQTWGDSLLLRIMYVYGKKYNCQIDNQIYTRFRFEI